MSKTRYFSSGATRDDDGYKYDVEGFFDPEVLEHFSAYMHRHRQQPDGRLRSSDNWQKGMPRAEYVKSLIRHTLELWRIHRGYKVMDKKTGKPVTIQDAACGIFFNVQGLLREVLLGRETTEIFNHLPAGSSALPCGCDPGCNDYKCEAHRGED